MNALLRIEDQRNQRAPTHCVVCGELTDEAVSGWAIESDRSDWILGIGGVVGVALTRLAGRHVMRVMLPVDREHWNRWQRRSTLALLVVCAGAGGIAAGVVRSFPGMLGLGVILAAAGLVMRARLLRSWWVGTQLRPDRGDIVVRRAHSRFNDDARKMYISSLKR